MEPILYGLIFLCGVALGTAISAAATYKNPVGVLKVACSEDEPYLFLELHKDIDAVCASDIVVFKVCASDSIPHD